MTHRRGFRDKWASSEVSISIFFLLVVSVFFIGCVSSPPSQTDISDISKGTDTPRTPEALVYVDEAMLRKPYAIIGGTVENASDSRLQEIIVELELQRRSDGTKERRQVKVKPEDLAPGERGSYALRILSDEWSDSRIVALRSETSRKEIGFKTSPGNRRPAERLVAPTPSAKFEKAQRPKRRAGDEEFINTPDDPVSVP